ncbi:hypothetical protein TYRP_016610 [Tyrophagus putrescentiae]|nr:hypothetical protein TYRP_016610 [Tyrophagus putrescentiae]
MNVTAAATDDDKCTESTSLAPSLLKLEFEQNCDCDCFPFSSLRSAASAGAASGTYATFPNSTASPFGPGSQFG